MSIIVFYSTGPARNYSMIIAEKHRQMVLTFKTSAQPTNTVIVY